MRPTTARKPAIGKIWTMKFRRRAKKSIKNSSDNGRVADRSRSTSESSQESIPPQDPSNRSPSPGRRAELDDAEIAQRQRSSIRDRSTSKLSTGKDRDEQPRVKEEPIENDSAEFPDEYPYRTPPPRTPSPGRSFWDADWRKNEALAQQHRFSSRDRNISSPSTGEDRDEQPRVKEEPIESDSSEFPYEDAEDFYRHTTAKRRESRVSLLKSQETTSSQSSREVSTVPSNANEFNVNVVEVNGTYKMLIIVAKKVLKQKKYRRRAEDDPDPEVIDYRVDVEVRMRSGEGWRKWDLQWDESGLSWGFPIDYFVATVERKIGELLKMDHFHTNRSLIKYSSYPVPCWSQNHFVEKGIAIDAFNERLIALDFIELRLKLQLGDQGFLDLYPNRYLRPEVGKGNGGYASKKRALYINRLRAIEWRWNFECERFGLPHLHIADWTNEEEDDESLRNLRFICHLIRSRGVEKLQANAPHQLKHVKCTADCGKCANPERYGKVKHCCNIKNSMNVLDDGSVEWVDEGKGKNVPWFAFECTEACGCGKKCENRRLQNGRQIVLCIFREPVKGWGVRCVSGIDNNAFVTEYAGEVSVDGSGETNNYDFKMMTFKAVTREGKTIHTPLKIAAKKMGNEARFFAHSCAPNMEAVSTIVNRLGLSEHHMAFIASRRIYPGEEASFDYFIDQEDRKESIKSMFRRRCSCGSSRCARPVGIQSDDGSDDSDGSTEDEPVEESEEQRGGREQLEEDDEMQSRHDSYQEEEIGGRFAMTGFNDYEIDESPGPSTSRRRERSPSLDGKKKRGVKRQREDQSEKEVKRKKEDKKKTREEEEGEKRREKVRRSLEGNKIDQGEEKKREGKKEEEEGRKKGKNEEKKKTEAKTDDDERRSRGVEKKGVAVRSDPRTSRESSISPNRLCVRATGRWEGPVIRNGRVVNLQEEMEDLERTMKAPWSPSSRTLTSSSSSSETSVPSLPSKTASSPSPSRRRLSFAARRNSGVENPDQESPPSKDLSRRDH